MIKAEWTKADALDLQPTCNQFATDCINRQAAIDAMRVINDGICEQQAIDALWELPSAQTDVPDRKVGKWTPVSEGLPKKNGRYLVTRGLNACGALWNRVYIINYSDLMGLKSERIWWDGNVGKSDFEHITDVVAWMPLPNSWKGE